MIIGAISIEEEIRAVASMASLILGLLAFFTNMRREALAEHRKRVPPIGVGTVWGALPDLLLVLLTGGAVLVMAPLCFDSFHLVALGNRSGAVPSMFVLIWLGFVFLLLFQVWIVSVRFYLAFEARPRAVEKGARQANP